MATTIHHPSVLDVGICRPWALAAPVPVAPVMAPVGVAKSNPAIAREPWPDIAIARRREIAATAIAHAVAVMGIAGARAALPAVQTGARVTTIHRITRRTGGFKARIRSIVMSVARGTILQPCLFLGWNIGCTIRIPIPTKSRVSKNSHGFSGLEETSLLGQRLAAGEEKSRLGATFTAIHQFTQNPGISAPISSHLVRSTQERGIQKLWRSLGLPMIR